MVGRKTAADYFPTTLLISRASSFQAKRKSIRRQVRGIGVVQSIEEAEMCIDLSLRNYEGNLALVSASAVSQTSDAPGGFWTVLFGSTIEFQVAYYFTLAKPSSMLID